MVLGVASISDPPLFLISGPMVASLRSHPLPLIVDLVEVLVCTRSFPLNVGLDLPRGSAVWVILFPILALVCASNRLHPDHPKCRDCFDSLNEHSACHPIPTQKRKFFRFFSARGKGLQHGFRFTQTAQATAFVGMFLLILQPE